MVIYHAQVYSIKNSTIVDRLGSVPPSWVGYGQEYGLMPVLNGNSYS